MGLTKRVINFITGIIIILFGILMMIPSEDGYTIVLRLLVLALIANGIKELWFYFTMARYMVGGIYIFYKGIFLLDAGLFAINLHNVPRQYAMLYLIGGLAFAGIVSILHAMEVRKLESGKWKSGMVLGIIQLVLAIVCLFFLNDPDILTFVYGLGLLNSGFSRVTAALRRSAIVYVK